ncbi:hypothetical protein BK133_11275 [Paenibacillus sp. FSL H8-0548]|uniref:hypothetical protein n=1 Tax=Paenibacillus sp. FSL H8-0548 TaxID=1920422 RepID=UPI00096FD50E|nr:hypothetical protein [Paenibacillus sp. FSL H8-0548]OMF35277.1 hypothetical protein BK133_11275 [Paenibacillus sp. FSL H8-0548]
MAYYLQMDGVDDRLVLPSMTFTEIIIDFKVNSKDNFERYWSLPLGAEFFQVASGAVNDQWSAGVSAVYRDGVSQTNLTPVMTIGVRSVVRSVIGSAKTAILSIFANGTGNIAHGDIYDVKIYNGAVLQAHYDIAQGNVQDQSGNGRHATLVGGTWVDDGPSEPIGVDVSYVYATRQTINASRTLVTSTKQVMHASRTTAAATKQSVYENRSTAYATMQSLYSDYIAFAASYPIRVRTSAQRSYQHAVKVVVSKQGQSSFAMLQQQYADHSSVLSTRQTISKDTTTDVALKQVVSGQRSYSYAVHIKIYDADKTIIKRVRLSASRVLRVQLQASKVTSVQLRGELK